MKKYFITLVFLAAIFMVSSAMAADYSSLIAKDPVAVVKMNIGSFFNNPAIASLYKGEIKKSLDMIFNEFEKKTGFSFTRDISDFGMFAAPDINLNAPNANGVCFFISGKFDRDKLIAEILKEKDRTSSALITVEEKNGLKVFKFENFHLRVVFLNENFVIIASEDIIEKIASKKFETAVLTGDHKDGFENCCFYAYLKLIPDIKKIVFTDEFLSKIPADLKDSILNLSELTVSAKSFDFKFNFKFDKADYAQNFKKNLDSFISMGEAKIKEGLSGAEDKLKNSASVFEIISSDAANLKTGYTFLAELLSFVKIEVNNENTVVNFSFPAQYAEAFSPESMPIIVGIVGIAAAVAIPNFKKARDRAREKKNGRYEEEMNKNK